MPCWQWHECLSKGTYCNQYVEYTYSSLHFHAAQILLSIRVTYIHSLWACRWRDFSKYFLIPAHLKVETILHLWKVSPPFSIMRWPAGLGQILEQCFASISEPIFVNIAQNCLFIIIQSKAKAWFHRLSQSPPTAIARCQDWVYWPHHRHSDPPLSVAVDTMYSPTEYEFLFDH